jgi:hypothetical protein
MGQSHFEGGERFRPSYRYRIELDVAQCIGAALETGERGSHHHLPCRESSRSAIPLRRNFDSASCPADPAHDSSRLDLGQRVFQLLGQVIDHLLVAVGESTKAILVFLFRGMVLRERSRAVPGEVGAMEPLQVRGYGLDFVGKELVPMRANEVGNRDIPPAGHRHEFTHQFFHVGKRLLGAVTGALVTFGYVDQLETGGSGDPQQLFRFAFNQLGPELDRMAGHRIDHAEYSTA